MSLNTRILKTTSPVYMKKHRVTHLNNKGPTSSSAHCWPAGGGVVSMVRFSLGGTHRCRCRRAGPLHQPQGLEGVVVQALLGEKAFRRVQQQQILTNKTRRGSPWVLKTHRARGPWRASWNTHATVSHSIILTIRLLLRLIVSYQKGRTMMWNMNCDFRFLLLK